MSVGDFGRSPLSMADKSVLASYFDRHNRYFYVLMSPFLASPETICYFRVHSMNKPEGNLETLECVLSSVRLCALPIHKFGKERLLAIDLR